MTVARESAPDTLEENPIMRVAAVSKTFAGRRVLNSVSLELRPGQIHALVGENGSGKSTLIKILCGIHDPDPGAQAWFKEEPVSLGHGGTRAHIGVVHQDLGLIGSLSAVDNLMLGVRPPMAFGRRIKLRETEAQARAIIGRFGETFDVTQPVATLGPAERTVVAIGRAISGEAGTREIVVLDEPTAALAAPEAQQLYIAIREIAAQGASVLFVSHHLREVFALSHQVTVLRDGNLVASRPTAEFDERSLVQMMVGRDLDEVFPSPPSPENAVAVRIRRARGGRVESLDLDVRRGEIVGLAGVVGSGREHVNSVLFGERPRTAGSVALNGDDLPVLTPSESIRRGIAYVPDERATRSCIGVMSIRENVMMPAPKPMRFGIALDHSSERGHVSDLMAEFSVKAIGSEQSMGTLSGGNQQKAILAKWLQLKPVLLLLDEPTQGIDIAAKVSLYELIDEAVGGGTAVILSSSDINELCHVCDRVIVMVDGRAAASLSGSELEEGQLLHAMHAT